MKTITLNDIEYVPKKDYDKKGEEVDIEKYFVTDPANVMAIAPLIKKGDACPEDLWEINLLDSEHYKAVDNKDISQTGGFDGESYTFSKTKFSKEYLDVAIKCGEAWCHEDKPCVYLPWDNKKKKYIENKPCILVFNKLCFILAPRVETE